MGIHMKVWPLPSFKKHINSGCSHAVRESGLKQDCFQVCIPGCGLTMWSFRVTSFAEVAGSSNLSSRLSKELSNIFSFFNFNYYFFLFRHLDLCFICMIRYMFNIQMYLKQIPEAHY